MKVKTEELIEITDKVDDILHDYGYIVDHDILAGYIFKTIRESYPNDYAELDGLDIKQLLQNLERLSKKTVKNVYQKRL